MPSLPSSPSSLSQSFMLRTQVKLTNSNNGKRTSDINSKLMNKLTEDWSSKETLKKLKLTTLTQHKPTNWELLNSPSSLKKNLNLDSYPKWSSQLELKPQKISNNTQLVPSIGPLKEESQELKTKDHVDHAGHSLPLVLLNHGLCSVENHGIFLNNNWLTVQLHMETTDVMVDGHQVLWNTSRITDLLLNHLIHTLLRPTHVLRTEVNSTFLMFFQQQDAMEWQLQLCQDHSQSPLMLLIGQTIDQASSTTVVPALTTLFF